ncbi:MAG: type VI secretion system tip protein TssI/VgrG [Myxococcota bacterium]
MSDEEERARQDALRRAREAAEYALEETPAGEAADAARRGEQMAGDAEELAGDAQSMADDADDAASEARALADDPEAAGSEAIRNALDATESLGGAVADAADLTGTPAGRTISRVADTVGTVAGVATGLADGIDSLAEAFGGGSGLREARYHFTAGDGDDGTEWIAEMFEMNERLNEPYANTVRLRTEDPTATGQDLLGQSAELLIDRGTRVRRITGIVDRVEQRSGAAGTRSVDVRLVPALCAARHTQNSRIFQAMAVPAILEEVLGQCLSPYGRECRNELTHEYPTREYCVQYQESDLEFVQRLLAEEGIAYHFLHEEGAEVMVLTDANESFSECLEEGETVSVDGRSDEMASHESVREFNFQNELRTTGTVCRDFDWTRPSMNTASGEAGEDGQGRSREVYEHREPMSFGDYSEPSYSASDGERQTELRQQARVMSQRLGAGGGDCVSIQAGMTFRLEGNGNPELDQQYLCIGVVHRGNQNPDGDAHQYENRFECIPIDVPYVPAREPAERNRPQIPGYCTATVVGPEGEEIHTDVHGRVLCRFHWDRAENPDDQASCWIRCVQRWAGPGRGTMHIPRIGDEVVISFEGGNPDRPLCTGSVYNGENTPPLSLPDEKDRTVVLRSESTPGGGGHNSIVSVDASGAEQLAVHAQRDYDETVLNDHTVDVGANQSISVGGNQSTSVGGNRTISVTGNLSESVTGTRTFEITDQEINRYQNGRNTTVQSADDVLTVDENRLLNVGKIHHTSAGQEANLVVGGTSSIAVDPQSIHLETTQKIVLKVGDSEIQILPSKIMVKSPEVLLVNNGSNDRVWLKDKILVESAAETVIGTPKAHARFESTDIKIAGTDVKANATSQLELSTTGGANVKLVGGDVKLND